MKTFEDCLKQIKKCSDYMQSEEYKQLLAVEKVEYLTKVLSASAFLTAYYGNMIITFFPEVNCHEKLKEFYETLSNRLPSQKSSK